MQKIPTYERRMSIPGTSPNVEQDIGSAGIVGNAIAKFGQTGMIASEEVSKTLARRQAEEDNIKLADLRNQYVKSSIDYEAQNLEKRGKDAFGIVDQAKVDLENQKVEALKGIDPRLIPHAQNILDVENNRTLDKLTLHALHEGEVAKVTARKETLDLAAQRIATMSDSVLDVKEEIALTAQIQKRLGMNDAELNLMQAQLATVAVQTAINNGDVVTAKEHIAEYRTLLDSFNMRDELEAKLKNADKDAKVTDAYGNLFEKFSGDFTQMSKYLDDPKNQKELGLTLETASYLKSRISAAQTDKEKADQVEWDKTAKDVFLNLRKMTPGKINNLVADGKLSYKLGEHFKEELNKETNTDPMTYYRVYTQVKDAAGDPDALLKVRQSIFNTFGLSFNDKKSLLAMTETEQDKHEAALTKRGMDYIQRTVMPSQTMISAAKPIEAAKYLEAAKAFDDAVSKAKQKGEKIDGAFIEKTSKEISQAYTMSVTDQIEAMNKRMKEDQEKRKAKKEAAKGKDKFGFAVGDTKIIQGKTYTYIGNDQWQ